MSLKNKVVVITGGGRGLGKELALILAKEGGKVIICSRHKNDLSKVCNEITDQGGACEYFAVDVTNKFQVEKFIKQIVKRHKRIDILINNAGYVDKWQHVENITEDEFENNFKINVYSIFYFLKRVVPIMRKQNEGSIINVSSMSGKRGIPNLAAYSASKFAVVGLAQSVAKELEGTGVYCITVCPGGMNTQMRAKIFDVDEASKQQDPKFVANVIKDIIIGKVKVPSAGDIVIRYGEITSINEAPK